jgi:hypothetical protein
VADTDFAMMADADDLPRTLRREREARERAARETEARKRNATLTHDYDARHDSAAVSDRRAHRQDAGAAAGVVTGFDVPFFQLVRFFIKAVFAGVPALIILAVMLWFAGAALKSAYPGLVHTEVVIRVPR